MPKHMEKHFFNISIEQFSCYYDMEYKKQPYWYPSEYLDCIWNIDKEKAFKTKEACEKYIREQVRKTCKILLKDGR